MIKLVLTVAIGISLTSCVTYPAMHYSVAQNVPLLTQKGDIRFSIATGTEIIGLQAAYAFSKSWAAIGSYSDGLDEIETRALTMNNYTFSDGSRRSGELAIGYFQAIDAKGIFEIYGGVERYYRSFSEVLTYGQLVQPSTFSTNCTKPFIQMDVGFHETGKHSFGLSFKFGLLTYDQLSFMVSDSTGNLVSHPNFYNPTPALIVEPCLTYRLGRKNLSFQAQTGFSFTGSSVGSNYYYSSGSSFSESFFFNVGLSLRIIKAVEY